MRKGVSIAYVFFTLFTFVFAFFLRSSALLHLFRNLSLCFTCSYTQWEPVSCGECLFTDQAANDAVVGTGSTVALVAVFVLDYVTYSDAMEPIVQSAVILKQLTTALTIQAMMSSYVFKVALFSDVVIAFPFYFPL